MISIVMCEEGCGGHTLTLPATTNENENAQGSNGASQMQDAGKCRRKMLKCKRQCNRNGPDSVSSPSCFLVGETGICVGTDLRVI
jgi:hypothetical protein